MSGDSSQPPALRARFGVKGHHATPGGIRFKRLHWHCDVHKKRLKLIRKISEKPRKF